MKIELNHIEVSEAGEYFQVLFEENKDTSLDYDPKRKYILIQRQFEFPDDDEVYIENNNFDYAGHCKIVKAELSPYNLLLNLKRTKHKKLNVRFKTTEAIYKELCRSLQIMIPGIIIKKC